MQPKPTHEPEICAEVDLCGPDGRLNSAARGWSRRPLHTGNLRGSWGRNKRWDYWAILAGDLVVSSVYADIDYLGLADVWWADLTTGQSGGRPMASPGSRGIELPDRPATAPLRARSRKLSLEVATDPDGTAHIDAEWMERGGSTANLRVTIDQPPGHESLNVVIPWSERRFQYTSKHQARPAHGELAVGDRRWEIGGESGSAWGVLDVGRGRWPYRTRWNWGGGAGPTDRDGPVIGLQMGAKWTDGTGFTENGVILDGRLTKLGEELRWDYDWNHPMQPWRVSSPDGRLEATLTPRYDRHGRAEALIFANHTHQVFGTWTGRFIDDDGTELAFTDIQGFAEESRSRW
ncbi:MAG: DUF2804 domain-containing protein [Microthrixaceae bacterium]|nr:DUF2804 domain-containing protein [Microthrixaceae bacterium]